MRRVMEDYSRARHVAGGYEFVNSPHITKAELFETSGHLEWFADGMYPPMELDDGQQYYLKPMNCPFHVLDLQGAPAQLPRVAAAHVRVRHGLSLREVRRRARTHARARHDPGRRAHLLHARADGRRAQRACSPSCSTCCATSDSTTSTSNSRRGPRARPSARDEEWDEAEATLADGRARRPDSSSCSTRAAAPSTAPRSRSRRATRSAARTSSRRSSSTSRRPSASRRATSRADNARHRPIMIHRALFGSVERFMAILIEHYAGNMPTWLSPEQVRVLGVRDDHDDYAHEVAAALRARRRARQRRGGQRAARRADPPGQAREDPLHPRGGRRRRGRAHRRGQRARFERPRARRRRRRVPRRACAAEIAAHGSPEAHACHSSGSPASWREAYVSSADAARTRATTASASSARCADADVDESTGRALARRAQLRRAQRLPLRLGPPARAAASTRRGPGRVERRRVRRASSGRFVDRARRSRRPTAPTG